ncbi:MAG TPA: DUF72 domain-containing protein [Conexivisphaerales archaeon]|nr:DUF72 domain-containing protein [Conexivisphaerales archaeon]
MPLRMGTCGWSYDEWLGVFYPSKDTPKLSYYSKVFKTAEVDSTFYDYPNEKVVFGWSKYSPLDFQFSLKVPQLITHKKRLSLRLGVESDLDRFLNLLKPLSSLNKIGVLLVQLPPSLSSDLELLESFLRVLPADVFNFAIEFRHESWWNEETWKLLRKYRVANTTVDEPLLPPEIVRTADFTYVRWHGLGKRVWYDYRYSKEQISEWVPKLKEALASSKEVYGYWNNHFHGYAVLNGLEAIELMGMMTPEQKEALASVTARVDGRQKGILDY